jgi:hypothetical protein
MSLLVLTIVAITCSHLEAKDLASWTKVQKLNPGTEVLVVDGSANRLSGYVVSVTPDDLKLNARVTNQPGLLSPIVLERRRVREVYKVGKKYEPRLNGKNFILASDAGLVSGIAIGAAVDAAHPSAEDPGQGKLIGGIVGFFFGPAALAAGRGVLSAMHKTKLIYRASPVDSIKLTRVAETDFVSPE